MYGLGDDILELNEVVKKLRARKARLLSENRKLRKRVKELEEKLVIARQRLEDKSDQGFTIRENIESGGW